MSKPRHRPIPPDARSILVVLPTWVGDFVMGTPFLRAVRARFADARITFCAQGYMQKLIDAYNPAAASGVMCRTMVSVGWDGTLYDCDFNQMLGLGLRGDNATRTHLRDLKSLMLPDRPIVVADHCYGCTAGQGSSCGGALTGTDG